MAVSVLTQKNDIPAGNAVDKLLAATADDMARVNSLILSRADSHVEMVPELARYLIESGGKRLRPMLTVAAALLFGKGVGNEVNFAAAVEFMHNATLLHDDVVDESDMRRGKPAARMVWGNKASILVGDFLLGQAFMMMVETGDIEALGVLSAASAVMAEGEVFQLAKTGDLTTTEADYAEVIRAKTAILFKAACEVGAMSGGADAAGRAALAQYGLELGNAFQLVDDALDYGGQSGALGKNVGDDLREGKMTLPVILALADGNEAERAIIAGALGKADASELEVNQVVAIFNRHNTLGRTLEKAHAHAEAAVAALASLQDNEMKTLLADVVMHSVSRAS
ncbi:polyprenyl synthetase family protein [Devosia sp. BK]|uniref:polyprenyl synthetase family protein n=1 Tax=unclassified Devosia TaxID=196773 RepID=UPI0007137001|nr:MULTISPECIES: polyprenyl synthetase family protein [unclassified Devosia]KQN77584.1 polyprenyl synthetase [Devosia sp. Leaf64]KQT49633.1 polyprenyl synthetase [Devosia sp. Leaf420]MDV3251682.1 polyprenyl synthetase family protein [Devosia sp. BK]